jgi:hypothetical protein
MTTALMPIGYVQPQTEIWQIKILNDDDGWTSIGKPLVSAGAFREFDPAKLLATIDPIWQAEDAIAMSLSRFAAALGQQQDAKSFRRDTKNLHSSLQKFLERFGNGNSAVIAETIKEMERLEISKKIGSLAAGYFGNASSSLILQATINSLRGIDAALGTTIEKHRVKGRDRNGAAYQIVSSLAGIYINTTGTEPGRSGGSSNSGDTPFERFVSAVLDQFDTVVTQSNSSVSESAKLELSFVDQKGTIQRVLAERKAPKKS